MAKSVPIASVWNNSTVFSLKYCSKCADGAGIPFKLKRIKLQDFIIFFLVGRNFLQEISNGGI